MCNFDHFFLKSYNVFFFLNSNSSDNEIHTKKSAKPSKTTKNNSTNINDFSFDDGEGSGGVDVEEEYVFL